MVEMLNDLGCLVGRCKISKCETPEDSSIEVIVECIWQWQLQMGHKVDELLLLDSEGDVLDDYCCGYKLLFRICRILFRAKIGHPQR